MQSYGKTINHTINQMPIGEIFASDTIVNMLREQFQISTKQAKEIANNKLKRMNDAGTIARVQRGLYYKPANTVFGTARPDLDKYFIQTLTKQGKQVIGYETGASFMNRIGLATLLPKEIEIATNEHRKVLPAQCHVLVKKPVTEITKDNVRYLQLLDAIDALPTTYVDADQPEARIRSFAARQELDPLTIIFTARRYYSAKTAVRTIDIFMKEDMH